MARVFFSVIIPTLDNCERLLKVLSAIRQQTLSFDRYEVIVVDNGSKDGTKEAVLAFSWVKFLEQIDKRRSPYSCRNLGAKVAKGDILVFLDSNCVPSREWLENADRLTGHGERLYATGGYVVERSKRDCIYQLYDSLFNVDAERASRKGWAPGGNLFIDKGLFWASGGFGEGVRSGEDLRLTKKVSVEFQPIRYFQRCIVEYPAKGKDALLRKQRRVAKGQVGIWRLQNRVVRSLIRCFSAAIVPNFLKWPMLLGGEERQVIGVFR
ncbi:glycosyltransferase family 2 protein [Alkalilimnicola ehrlichii]|uniref:Glycosyltransferase 2-like domain-containing protein n=1 Tax=Alkalilimnicola ehrlichii TaxID=351052 RepID=A0A3E0X090_9GAMM|nr:glycosyltransferase family A protein [Alkalilimnicola ehrlichii]RFA37831.1 hypothetical protein CAL65_07790 [Alkalilimnicola ehrlichii]